MYLFKLWFSWGVCPGVELLGHMVFLFLVFQGTSILFSIVAAPIYIPTNSVGGLPSLHTLSSIICIYDHLSLGLGYHFLQREEKESVWTQTYWTNTEWLH